MNALASVEPGFELTMVRFDSVVDVPLGVMQGGRDESSRTLGYAGARSVVTSTGTAPVASALAKNVRAAVKSGLADSHTSMTCPS